MRNKYVLKMEILKYTRIKSLTQYNEYCDIYERFFSKNDPSFLDELELLELLIQDFENKSNQTKHKELNPVELLKNLMENAELKPIELAKELNVSKQLLSDILNYRRNISKSMVLKLSEHFSMNQAAFSRPYQLKIGNR